MRRGILFIFALPVMLAGFVMAAPAALAVSPHFVSASATVNADGSLTVARRARRAPELAQVSYTSVSITDTTNGIPAPIPGTFAVRALPAVRRSVQLAPSSPALPAHPAARFAAADERGVMR